MSQNARQISKNHRFTTRVLKSSEMGVGLVSAWEELEARAVVPNAFMSPFFVRPALRYLETSDDIFGVFVEKSSGGPPNLVGVALFQVRNPTRSFPLKHLKAFESAHSYLSDFLLDQEYANDALAAIYDYLTNKSHDTWHGLRLNNFSPHFILKEETRAIAAEYGMKWNLFEQWSRAVFFPKEFGQEALNHLSKGQKKNYLRNLRKFQELGSLEWALKRGVESLQEHVEEFIHLEHAGWKGEKGTSLYSNPNHVNFFREMIKGFNEKGRAFFTELRLNGKNISSTSNLISGKAGFGFKVGWDIEYAKHGPGTVNELKTLQHGHEFLPDLEFMDSSSAPDSYMTDLWPGRRDIYEGMFSLTAAGRVAIASRDIALKLKNSLFRGRQEAARERSEPISS